MFFSSAVFDKDELRQALTPVLDKLVKQDPESLPFRTPVDPVVLHIPVSCFIVHGMFRSVKINVCYELESRSRSLDRDCLMH